jgi:2-hydroxychromene-2-carboxylate isomerase
MTQKVEFFYDFRSPYSYLAFTQLVGMKVDLKLRPIQILKVMEKVGNVPTTITCAAKGRYARDDLGRWAQRYGLVINPSNMRENDGDACSRAVLSAPTQADAVAITLALYRAIWSEAKTLANSSDVLAAIKSASIDTTLIAKRIDTADITAKLATNTDEAAARGVFGSPTMFVGDKLFFGNDRLDFVQEELTRLEKVS